MKCPWVVLCCLLLLASATLNCAPDSGTAPPHPNPEVLDRVTGVKVENDSSGNITLLVLLQPSNYADNARTTIGVIKMNHRDCIYLDDVPENEPAQVWVYDSNNCLRNGYCSGSRVTVRLHSFNELH